jgi:hypothetical protein
VAGDAFQRGAKQKTGAGLAEGFGAGIQYMEENLKTREKASDDTSKFMEDERADVEALKYRWNRGKRGNLNFYRDSRGNEVDLLVSIGSDLFPVEIKAGATIGSDAFKGLEKVSGSCRAFHSGRD